MNKKYLYLQIILVAVSIAALALSFYNYRAKEKTGWIAMQQVYNGFEYKKELEAKLTNAQQARKNILDSLEFEMELLAKQIRHEKGVDKKSVAFFQVKREDYLKKKQWFDEDNQAMIRKYDEQILNQLNQYVKDYAKEKGYDFIYAADGNGTIMAAPDYNNMTAEVTQYINDRYKGGPVK
jgi:outer membrane protein